MMYLIAIVCSLPSFYWAYTSNRDLKTLQQMEKDFGLLSRHDYMKMGREQMCRFIFLFLGLWSLYAGFWQAWGGE